MGAGKRADWGRRGHSVEEASYAAFLGALRSIGARLVRVTLVWLRRHSGVACARNHRRICCSSVRGIRSLPLGRRQ